MVNYMNDILEMIQELKVVPVVVIDNADDAAPLAKALVDGGLPIAEVTFRTAAASAAIEKMVGAFPQMCGSRDSY